MNKSKVKSGPFHFTNIEDQKILDWTVNDSYK